MSVATPEDARELQSELRKLDRALKEIDANVKKYEKLLLAHTTLTRADDTTAVEFNFTPDEKSLQKIYKMLTELKLAAEKQLTNFEKCKQKIDLFSRACSLKAAANDSNATPALASSTSAAGAGSPPPLSAAESTATTSLLATTATTAAALLATTSNLAASLTTSNASVGVATTTSTATTTTATTTTTAAAAAAATSSLTHSSDNLAAPPAKRPRPNHPTVAQKGPNTQGDAPPREGELVGARESRISEYILARVIQYLPTKQRYIVADADPTLGPGQKPRQFQVAMHDLIPMRLHPHEYAVGAHVYAVFPETSTLYLAQVKETPSQRHDGKYMLVFFDDDDSRGRTPNRLIAPELITAKRESK